MAEHGARGVPDALWDRVFGVIDRAGDAPPDRRWAAIRAELADSPEALALAESLCRLDGSATRFLEHDPAAALPGGAPEQPGGDAGESGDDALLGERLGVFEVVEPVASGGMGRVYRGRRADGLYDQTVAIKVLLGDAGSPGARERFRIERRVLARLTHPGIARILDGGVTGDGRPYFVMEFVDGERLDRAIAGTGLDDRLALFERIADAVRYAHAHAVIHRDLKPANVLVTREGTPRLLDFGIAKVLDDAGGDAGGGVTLIGERPLTPQYAAPEQIRGEGVSQATDVYGLGLLLYEMVTGSRPYSVTGSRAEAERVVCETDPAPASEAAGGDAGARRWASRLRGDLDRIVRTAISKSPEDRYASVDRLLEDIRRFRERRPILARPPSARYATAMLVRRHPVPSFAAAAALVGLVAGLGFVTAAYGRATRAARAEQAQREIAEQVGVFLDDMLRTVDPSNAMGRDTALLREILDRAHARLRSGAIGSDAVRAPLEHRLGATYAAIGSTERAEDHLAEAERLWASLGRSDAPAMADTLVARAILESERGRFAEAEPRLVRAIAIRRGQPGGDTAELGVALDALGGAMLNQGRMDDARAALDEAWGILEGRHEPGEPALLHTINKRAIIAAQSGDNDGARAMLRPHAGAVVDSGVAAPVSCATLNTMAILCSRAGDHDESLRWHQRCVEMTERLYGAVHAHTLKARANRAVARERAGFTDEAEADYRSVLASQEGALGVEHPDTISTRQNLGTLLVRAGEAGEALPVLTRALDESVRVLGAGHPSTAMARASLGEALIDGGEPSALVEAEALLVRAIEDLERALGPDAGPAARARRTLGRLRDRSGANGE
jgi:tetratricopeptide (TPR) repeat protein/predicted Ser/Thr protein kinase